MKKLLIFALTVIILTLSLISCSKKDDYRDDVPCAQITDAIKKDLSAKGGYAFFEEDQIKFIFDDISLADEYSVLYSLLSQNIDEFGVFHADNEKDARELFDECREYIEEKYEDENAFISSYAPEELPKLKDGEVKVFGNYVVFAILSENDRAALFAKVEEMLKQQ